MSQSTPPIPGPLGHRPASRKSMLLLPWLMLKPRLPSAFDLLSSLFLLYLLWPLLLLRGFLAYLQTGKVFARQTQVGRYQQEFERLAFAGQLPGKGLAALLNVVQGELAWAGPRALAPEELPQLSSQAFFRFNLRPGLISRHVLRKKIGLAYDDELSTDHRYYYSASAKDHVGLSLRGVIGSLLGGGKQDVPVHPMLHFLGIDIVNTTMAEALDWFEQRVQAKQKSLLFFANPACLNIAYEESDYRHVLQEAERVLPDGIGIKIGCRMLNEGMLDNINGTDFFPRLCERAANTGLKLYLLGGLPGVAALAAQAMQKRYPKLIIAGTRDGYFDHTQESDVINSINLSGADILLVGMGAPKQELWLARHRGQLQPSVCMGVGGLFDFYSGRIPRAPVWMREIGMEWAWRIAQEPGRMWRRYIVGNPLFLYRVWLQRQRASRSGKKT